MSTPVLIEEVMENLKRIPMSQERFNSLKEKIIQSRALTGPDESVINLHNMTMKCVQDIKDRLAYITERRNQRIKEDKQKNLDFAAALAERDAIKESEKWTKRGQKAHRTRIELWRDEVKQHGAAEKKTISGTVPQQQQSSRQSTAKRPHDNTGSSLEQVADTATPANKRFKTVTQNHSSSAMVLPTSSKKSIPWLSTRASMAEENIFADDDRPIPNQVTGFNRKNTHDDHDDYDDYDDYEDEDADEEFKEDEDSDYSDDSYLTELEQMLTTKLAMVVVLTLALPRMMERSDAFRQGLEEGGFS